MARGRIPTFAMKSRSRFFLLVSLGSVWLENTTLQAAEEKAAPTAPAAEETAQLKPVAVSTVFVSIRLRPFYRDSATGPRVSRLMIEEVRARSLADRAGVQAGMELLAVQGTAVTGLRDVDLEKLCESPVVGDTLVLKVAEQPKIHGSVVIPREIRVPLAKTTADKLNEPASTREPKKRRPARSDK
jgi:predicted metalloprotease with PDZ domain